MIGSPVNISKIEKLDLPTDLAVSNSFFSGVQLSKDRSCVLATTNMKHIAFLDDFPSKKNNIFQPKKKIGRIYDFLLYPAYSKDNERTKCYFTVSRSNPLQLWNIKNSKLRASYVPKLHSDDLAQLFSMTFDEYFSGSTIYCGSNSKLYQFDVTQPGKQYATSYKAFQKGILSHVEVNPKKQMISLSSFNGYVSLVPTNTLETSAQLKFEKGVVQTKFSCCGNYILVNIRQDNNIYVYDIRNLLNGKPVFKFERVNTTNQRLIFDIFQDEEKELLITGSSNGIVHCFDILSGTEVSKLKICDNVSVNCVSCEKNDVIISYGERSYLCLDSDSDSDSDFSSKVKPNETSLNTNKESKVVRMMIT